MCAIVDANVVAEVFGLTRPPAGVAFFKWINSGNARLVVGGKLRSELDKASKNFRQWALEAQRAGILNSVNDAKVGEKTDQLVADHSCKSNDSHVVALAQLGGARLLYSNDGDLQQDFKNRTLINKPKGKVYSTKEDKSLTPGLRRLLRLKKKDLCGAPQ